MKHLLVTSLRHLLYEERLRQLNLFSLARRRLRADLIIVFKIFKVKTDLNPPDYFIPSTPQHWLRGHTYTLLQRPNCLQQRCGAFSAQGGEVLNQLVDFYSHVTLSART